MLTNPRPGQPCVVWYRKQLAPHRPLHGLAAVVVTPGRGKPRNHMIEIAGVLHVIPCGNLRKIQP